MDERGNPDLRIDSDPQIDPAGTETIVSLSLCDVEDANGDSLPGPQQAHFWTALLNRRLQQHANWLAQASTEAKEFDAAALDQEIRDTLKRLDAEAEKLEGRQVRILSSYNGQMAGRSRKPLTGQVRTVRSAFADNDGIGFWIEGYEYGCPALRLKDVELLPAAQPKVKPAASRAQLDEPSP